MALNIAYGNAAADGQMFNNWFIGDIEGWCKRDKIPFDESRFGLQSTHALEMKWTIHKKGEERPRGWANCSDHTTITILIKGSFTIQFRDPDDSSHYLESRLDYEGDYVMWRENVEHLWKAEEDSVTLTVRWPKILGSSIIALLPSAT